MFGDWKLTYDSVSYEFGNKHHQAELVSWEQGADMYTVNDVQAPGDDGVWFGEDHVEAGEILINVKIDYTSYPAPTEECVRLALAAREELERVWRADWVRAFPNRLAELHMGGRIILEGRPRRVKFDDSAQNVGLIFAQLPFIPANSSVILVGDTSDGWNEAVARLVPPEPRNGWVFPLVFPLVNLEPVVRGTHFGVLGTTDTWVVARISGPIQSGAELELVGGWILRLNRALGPYDVAEVDARPGRRTLTVNGTPTNFLTPSSSRVSELKVSPGDRQIILRGTSLEGTASAAIRWRDMKAGK